MARSTFIKGRQIEDGTITGDDVDESTLLFPTETLTSGVTLDSAHHTVLVNTSEDIILPAAASHTGRRYIIKRVGTSSFNLKTQTDEYVDGDQNPSELSFDTQYDVKIVQSDGSRWYLLNEVHYGAQ